MNGFLKRMCILKQLKSGFSADGNPLGGVVRVEKYGKLFTTQLSLINFAPLSDGRYVCVLCDKQGERLIFPLSSQTDTYKTENSPFDPEKGFCALICFLKNDVIESLAAGQYGSGNYSVKLLLNGLTSTETTEKEKSSVRKEQKAEKRVGIASFENEKQQRKIEFVQPQKYDDDAVSERNYYTEVSDDEKRSSAPTNEDENAYADGKTEKENGIVVEKNDSSEKLLHPFNLSEGQEYYLSIKEELEELFATHARINDLKSALPNSEWVRVEDAGGCLVGVIYEELQVRYIAYALPAQTRIPPEELKDACFIPVDPLSENSEGYFVLFQDAATGESVRIEQA